MESLSTYLQIVKLDLSRDGSTVRNLLFESLTGPSVQDQHLLSQLADVIGARKSSVYAGAVRRSKLETEQKLVPIVSRLQRQSPHGQNVISNQWKIEAVGFFETEAISDVLKGHNNVFRVSFN